MQIDKEHWKICVRCEKSWDDDGALYCDKQEECEIIERDKPIHERVNYKTQVGIYLKK